MARKPTPIAVAASRTVVSACWTAALWILWACMLVVIGFLLTIHFNREIPVPGLILKRLEAQFAEAELQPRIGSTRFDPKGTLVLEDVRIHTPLFAEPVASARAIVLNLDLWAVATGSFDVEEIEIVGLDLNCPAMFSPSGMNMPVVRDLHASLERVSSGWRVPRADFRIGRLTATLRGEFDQRGGAKLQIDAKEWMRRYYDMARTLSQNLTRLESLGPTRLDATFSLRRNEPLRIHLEGDVSHLTVRGVTLSDLRVRADYDGGRSPADPIVVDVVAPQVTIEDRVRLERPHVRVTGGLAIKPFKFTPGPLEFAVHRAEFEDKWVDSLIFRTSLAALPVVEGEIAASHRGAIVRAIGSADPREGSLAARVEARVDAATIQEGLDIAAKRVRGRMVRELHFNGPAELEADVQLGNRWKFLGAQGSARALDADLMGVAAAVAGATFDITPTRLYAPELVLQGGNLHATGSYEMNIATRDYRFLIRGTTFPEPIAEWFTGWWPLFWGRFTFAADSPPEVDLEVRGRWRSPRMSRVVGSVKTGGMTIYGLPFDKAFTRLFVRDRYYDVLEVAASAGDRRIDGWFTHDERDLNGSTRRIRFDARSTLEVPRYSRLAGPEVLEAMRPFVFEDRADVAVSGLVDFALAGGFSEDITAAVRSSGTFRFFEFPVQNAEFNVRSRNGVIDIRDVTAGLAGGKLTGASVSGPGPAGRTVKFNARLAGSRMDELSVAYHDFRKRSAPPGTPGPDPAESALSGQGILNMDLEAEGPAANPWGFSGKGAAQITQAEFGRIRLFGPLSQLFEGTIFNFTSFRFTDANARFTLNGDMLVFEPLQIMGTSARLRSFGNYAMRTGGLEFNTTLFPFRESPMPVMGLIGLVLEPFSRALELRLTGTLAKPQWSFAAGQSIPVYERVQPPEVQSPGAAPPEAPAAPAEEPPPEATTPQAP